MWADQQKLLVRFMGLVLHSHLHTLDGKYRGEQKLFKVNFVQQLLFQERLFSIPSQTLGGRGIPK